MLIKCTVHDMRAGCSISPTSSPQTHTHTHTSPHAIITEAYPVFISRRTAAKYPDKYRFLCKLIVSALSAACFFPLKCCPFVNRLTKTQPTEYQIFCPLTSHSDFSSELRVVIWMHICQPSSSWLICSQITPFWNVILLGTVLILCRGLTSDRDSNQLVTPSLLSPIVVEPARTTSVFPSSFK